MLSVVIIEAVCVVSFVRSMIDVINGIGGAVPAMLLLGATITVYTLWVLLIFTSMFD